MCRCEVGAVASDQAHLQKWLGFFDCAADFVLELGIDDMELAPHIALAVHIGCRLGALEVMDT